MGQGISLVVTPLLARLYPPNAFGEFALVLGASALIAPAVALRLESALMLPASDRRASALLWGGCASAVLTSALCAGILELVFTFGILGNLAELPFYSLWVAGIAFLTSLFTLVGQYALRQHQYADVAKRTVFQAVVTSAAQLALAPYSHASTGLLAGYAAGRAAGIIPLVIAIRGSIRSASARDAWSALREYWRFPIVFAPSALLNAAGLMLPLLFVGSWFTVAEAGRWAMAERLLAVPLALIATAVGQVVEAHLSQGHRERRGGAARYYLKVSLALGAAAALLLAAVFFLAPPLIPILLGDGWDEVVTIVIALSPMIAARLVASPMSRILLITQRVMMTVLLDVARAVAVVGALVGVVILELTLIEFAWCISITLTVVYAATWLLGWHAARGADAPHPSN